MIWRSDALAAFSRATKPSRTRQQFISVAPCVTITSFAVQFLTVIGNWAITRSVAAEISVTHRRRVIRRLEGRPEVIGDAFGTKEWLRGGCAIRLNEIPRNQGRHAPAAGQETAAPVGHSEFCFF